MTPRFFLKARPRLLALPGENNSVEAELGRLSHDMLGFDPRPGAKAVIDRRDGKPGKWRAACAGRHAATGGEVHQSDGVGASRDGQEQSVGIGLRPKESRRLGFRQRVGVSRRDVSGREARHRLGRPRISSATA